MSQPAAARFSLPLEFQFALRRGGRSRQRVQRGRRSAEVEMQPIRASLVYVADRSDGGVFLFREQRFPFVLESLQLLRGGFELRLRFTHFFVDRRDFVGGKRL